MAKTSPIGVKVLSPQGSLINGVHQAGGLSNTMNTPNGLTKYGNLDNKTALEFLAKATVTQREDRDVSLKMQNLFRKRRLERDRKQSE